MFKTTTLLIKQLVPVPDIEPITNLCVSRFSTVSAVSRFSTCDPLLPSFGRSCLVWRLLSQAGGWSQGEFTR